MCSPTLTRPTPCCETTYAHEIIDHAESYVRGRVHTNGLENFWSLLEAGHQGRSNASHLELSSLPPGPLPIAFAHRGGSQLWPENTMRSFEGAVGLGCRYLETDVHLSKDGVLVTIHDATVDRTTDGSGLVRALPLAELKRLDAGYRFSPDGGRTHPHPRSGREHPHSGRGGRGLPAGSREHRLEAARCGHDRGDGRLHRRARLARSPAHRFLRRRGDQGFPRADPEPGGDGGRRLGDASLLAGQPPGPDATHSGPATMPSRCRRAWVA